MKVEIKNLNKQFKDKKIYDNFNLTIESGCTIAIMGKSGCGKSTLLNIIGLLDEDFDGEIMFDGLKIDSKKKRLNFLRQDVGYLFQNYGLMDQQSVGENLLISLKFTKYSKKEKLVMIDDVLRLFDLEGYSNNKIFTLSGGEQQRVAMAKLHIKPCSLILADEPTGNLDNDNSDIVIDQLLKVGKEKTVIIVTHDEKVGEKCDLMLRI